MRFRSICTGILLLIICRVAIAQTSSLTTSAVPAPPCQHEGVISYDPLVYDAPTSKCPWRRPENVRFVYLQGCGGGAGGQSHGNPKKLKGSGPGAGGFPPGEGGGAGALISVVVGPLTQDDYKISIGDVATPDKNGNASSFSGADANVVFSGGFVGSGNGRNSPFAKGGSAIAPYLRSMAGDAGLGAGGNAGIYSASKKRNGTDGGRCAGGGAGLSWSNPPRADAVKAGKGGSGYLMIIPYVPFSGPVSMSSEASPAVPTTETTKPK